MSLPAIPNATLVLAVFRGSIAGNDPLANPLENVQWFQYLTGVAPQPAGVPLNDMASRALGRWATFWREFQSQDFSYFSCTLRPAAAFVAVAPNRYRVTLASQWTDNTPQGVGGVASEAIPAFNAFGVRKLTALPGRGKQGQIRIAGVPKTSVIGNAVNPLVVTALDAALTPSSLVLNVSTAMAFSDALFPIVVNGKLVNTVPGQPPQFYLEFIEGFTASTVVSSQVTRRTGRRRS